MRTTQRTPPKAPAIPLDRARRRRFERHLSSVQGDLERVALSIVGGSRADADDLVQDTSLRALRGFHQFREGTNFKAWILTLMRTAHIDRYRWIKRRPWTLSDEVVSCVPSSAYREPGVERYLETHDEKELEDLFDDRLQRALDGLPEDFRRVLLLSKVAGLGCQEIASLVACASGTVKSRVCRATAMLRNQLQGEMA